jgi:GAF domain-containing protein
MRNWIENSIEWLLFTKPSSSKRERWRGRLLASILVLSAALLTVPVLVDLISVLTRTDSNARQYFLSNLISLVVVIGLWLLNRQGLQIWAGTALIIFLIVLPNLAFLPEKVDRLFIAYAIPVVLAGFVLHPLASIAAMILSLAAYSYIFYMTGTGGSYNYLSGEVLLFISIISTIIAALLSNSINQAEKNESAQREANAQLEALHKSLQQQVEERTRQIRAAAEAAQTITTATTVAEILNQTAKLVREQFGYYHVGIYGIEGGSSHAKLMASAGEAVEQIPQTVPVNENNPIGWVLLNRSPKVIKDEDNISFLPNPLFPIPRVEAVIPILAHEQLLGVLDVHSDKVDSIDEISVLALEIVARQAAAAIQNLQFVDAARVDLVSISNVYRYGHIIAQANSEFDIFEAARRALSESAYKAILFIVEETGLRNVVTTVEGALPEWIDINPIILEEAFATGSIIGNIEQLSTLPTPLLRALSKAQLQDVALVPVKRNERLRAILVIGSKSKQPVSPIAIQPYASMAELIVSSLERIRIELKVESRLNELEAITVTSQALASVNNLDTLYSVLHEHIRKNMGDITFIVALYDAKTNSIHIPYLYENAPGSERATIESFPLGEGLTSILIRTKQPLMLVEDTERRAMALGAKISGKPAKSWLGTPLIVSNDVIGALIVQDPDRENAFDESDLRFLTTLSAQVAGAIYNIRLLEETSKRAIQLQTAAEIARDISGSLDLSEVLNRAVMLIRERFNFYHAAVFLVDSSGTYAVIREATGDAGVQMKRSGYKLKVGSKSIVGYVTGSGEHLIVNDTSRDATYYPNPLLPDTKSEVAIPLKVGARVLGALDVQSDKTYAFSTEDVNVLRILADQLAIAVINSELFAETQEHLSQHRLLHHVTTAAASGTTLDEALNSAAQGLQVTLGGDRVAIMLADREKKVLKVEAVAGFSDEVRKLQIPFGKGITGWVAVHQKPLRVNDVQADPRYKEVSSNTRSEIAIPLSYRGELLGVLNAESDQPGAYSENDEELLGTLGGSLAAIIANARLLEQIRRQVERERLLYEVTSKIRRSTDMQTILATTASELSKALGAHRAKILLDIHQETAREKDE